MVHSITAKQEKRLKIHVLFLAAWLFLGGIGDVFCSEDLTAAEALFEEGDHKACLRHLKGVTEEDPDNLRAWVLMGRCYGELKKDRKAVKAYEKALKIDPAQEEALFGLAMSYARLDKRPVALAAFKKVVEVNPFHAEAHYYLGVIYEAKGSIGKAWEEYKILKTLDERLAEKLYHVIFW
jgi:cytochrome c-type biogenesis protein CcmH/NrfG